MGMAIPWSLVDLLFGRMLGCIYRSTDPDRLPAFCFSMKPLKPTRFVLGFWERSIAMKRTIEWTLAAIGVILCIGGTAPIWIPQAAFNPPGYSLWPMPALLFIEVALLGVVGFLGIALEPQFLSTLWGTLVWITCGGLLALSLLGAISISVIVFLALPGLAFGGAAILADRRRERKMLPDLGVLAVSGIANFGLFFAIITIGRG